MTDFYVSVAKVEGSGDTEVEFIQARIAESIQYLYGFSIKAVVVNENTIKITYKEA